MSHWHQIMFLWFRTTFIGVCFESSSLQCNWRKRRAPLAHREGGSQHTHSAAYTQLHQPTCISFKTKSFPSPSPASRTFSHFLQWEINKQHQIWFGGWSMPTSLLPVAILLHYCQPFLFSSAFKPLGKPGWFPAQTHTTRFLRTRTENGPGNLCTHQHTAQPPLTSLLEVRKSHDFISERSLYRQHLLCSKGHTESASI